MPSGPEQALLRRQRRTPARRRLGIGIGTAVLLGIAAVTWHIVRRVPAAPVAAANAPAPAPPAPIEPRPQPPQSGGVTGVVLLPSGQPAAGARVKLYRARSSWPEWDHEVLESVATSFTGEFRFATERGPDLLVSFELDNHAGDLVEAPAELPRLSLQLRPGHVLSGYVTDGARQPQSGCRVALEPLLGENRRTVTANTGPDGIFRFTNVAAGAVRVVARHPSWQPAVLPNVTIGAQPSVELRFERPAVVLKGSVLTAGQPQRPIANARILARPQASNAGLLDPTMMMTKADGSFELAELGRGNYRIEVRHPEFSTVITTLAIGQSPPPQQFELVPRSHVSGTITMLDPDAGLPPMTTLLLRARSGELARAAIAADGSFEFAEAMPVGWSTLEFSDGARAFDKTGTAALQVRIEESARTELHVEVATPSRIHGRITDHAGKPVAGALLYATQAEQLAATLRETGSALLDIDLRRLGSQLTRAAAATPERLLAVTDVDGRWRTAGQSAGGLVVRIEHPDFATRRIELQVQPAPAITTAPVIELADSRSLRGRIDRGGRPLAGAVVTVGTDTPQQAISGADGRYELPGLPPGSYRVKARYSALPPLQRDVTLGDHDAGEIDFTFPAGRMIKGTVVGNDGLPVEGAMVMVRGTAGAPTVTDASGEFDIELPRRRVELQVFLGDRNALKVQPVAVTDRTVTIHLDVPATTSLHARIFGLPGRTHPASVLLKVTPLDGADDRGSQARLLDLANGELRYPWFPAQPSHLTLICEGYAPFEKDLEATVGIDLDLPDILLEPGATLEGRVVDHDGRPVPGCVVFLGDEADLDLFTPQTRTEADGRFSLAGVCTASRTLVARAQGFAPRSLELQLPRDVLRQEPLSVVLERGATIEVTVTGADTGGYVLLLRQDRVIGSAEFDADAHATFVNRGVGSYTVQLLGDPRRAAVEVGESGGVVKVAL